MKKISLLIPVFCIGLLTNVFSQKASIELTFTAVNNSQIILLDSVYVENLTQGGDTTIYAPETKLELEYVAGIDDWPGLAFNKFKNYCNYIN